MNMNLRIDVYLHFMPVLSEVAALTQQLRGHNDALAHVVSTLSATAAAPVQRGESKAGGNKGEHNDSCPGD